MSRRFDIVALTPAERRRWRAPLRHGVADSPFGLFLAAETAGRLCALHFMGVKHAAETLDALRRDWPACEQIGDDALAEALAPRLFSPESLLLPESLAAPNGMAAPNGNGEPFWRLCLAGTPFQLAVWRALAEAPPGAVTSYAALARAIGRPAAARAVGNAVGANPIGWLLPCHRVLRQDGALGGYRWGSERKQAMLAWEREHLAAGDSRAAGSSRPAATPTPADCFRSSTACR